jgi:hypothetical protein
MDIYHFLAVIAALTGIFLLAGGLKIRFRTSERLDDDGGPQDGQYISVPEVKAYQKTGLVKLGLLCLVIAAVLEIRATGIPSLSKKSFPTEKDFQSYSYTLEHDRRNSLPPEELTAFLHQIQNPEDVYQTVLVEDFFQFLSKLYLTTEDIAILKAVDSVMMTGSAANAVCGFYSRIIKNEKAVTRYRANRIPIQRCIGLSISPEEYKMLIE